MYYMDHLSLLVYKTCHPSVVFFAILKVCVARVLKGVTKY